MRSEEGELGKLWWWWQLLNQNLLIILSATVWNWRQLQVRQGRLWDQEEEPEQVDGGVTADGARQVQERVLGDGQGAQDEGRRPSAAGAVLPVLRKSFYANNISYFQLTTFFAIIFSSDGLSHHQGVWHQDPNGGSSCPCSKALGSLRRKKLGPTTSEFLPRPLSFSKKSPLFFCSLDPKCVLFCLLMRQNTFAPVLVACFELGLVLLRAVLCVSLLFPNQF